MCQVGGLPRGVFRGIPDLRGDCDSLQELNWHVNTLVEFSLDISHAEGKRTSNEDGSVHDHGRVGGDPVVWRPDHRRVPCCAAGGLTIII